jgi:hypothetical protein
MKGGEAARKRNRCPFGMISGNISEDKPLLTRVTRHGKKFPFIFIYPLEIRPRRPSMCRRISL